MPVEDTEEHFEDRLGAALHQVGGTYETDRRTLIAAGEVRGRRLLVRRKASVLGGVAGVALVGLGGALLLPGDGDDGRRTVVASPAASGKASAQPGTVSGDELVRTLQELLPEGEFSGQQSRGTDSLLPPYALTVYDDGQGKAAVSLSLNRIDPGSEQSLQAVTCPDKVLTPYDSCVTSRLPDGSKLMLFKGYEYPDRRVDTKRWSADLITPQGQHVSVTEWNAAAEKDAPISRPEPPLSTAQLKTVVTDTAWRTAIDSVPENPTKPATTPEQPPAGIDGPAIRSTLVSLLPEDVEVVSEGGQDTEYAYVVVDDGEGKSLVQINVQPDMSDVEGQLFGADAETLPDGTKVATHQGPGEKGGAGVVMWTADTIRTDGRRVVISAFNSGSQNASATRDTPALTIEELKDIATSAKWIELA
ncbi:hypothetical protein OG548_15805 [Streptomyces sp. NBC_01356]|uniref:hypothetical protein n=1 Tax=Streptomyces sp. NBC_01356 TaxID=2903836 RepID=UPI002E344BC0|nr:hypothetical protein [Streptomyces sp. NBC_01356]